MIAMFGKKTKKYTYDLTSLLMKTGLFKKETYANALLVALSVGMFAASGYVLYDSPVVRADISRFVANVMEV